MKKDPSSIVLLKNGLSRSGGLEKYTRQIAEEFVRKGKKVTILTTHTPPSYLQKEGIEVVNFPSSSYFSFSKVLQFDRRCHHYLQSHASPIVFGLDRNRFQTHYRAGNGVHAAYLKKRAQEEGWLKRSSFLCNPLHHILLHFEKTTFEHPELKALFTNSFMVKEEILNHYQVSPHKIHVIHNGVEWEQMDAPFKRWPEEKLKHCQLLQLDPSAYQFLFLGHNYQRKGLEKLLKALALLNCKQVQLSVVGNDRLLPYFQKMTHKLGLGNQVFFFGAQYHTTPFYQIADALVVPSLYDPFANVTVEALSMGLFVVSSCYNGGKEILTEENGRVIPDLTDVESFAHLLKQVTSLPKTQERAATIRNSVAHLDFSCQLRKISDLTFHT